METESFGAKAFRAIGVLWGINILIGWWKVATTDTNAGMIATRDEQTERDSRYQNGANIWRQSDSYQDRYHGGLK